MIHKSSGKAGAGEFPLQASTKCASFRYTYPKIAEGYPFGGLGAYQQGPQYCIPEHTTTNKRPSAGVKGPIGPVN